MGALRGYEHANATALELWEKTYPNVLQIALTDTFSTEAFYKVRTSIYIPFAQYSRAPFVADIVYATPRTSSRIRTSHSSGPGCGKTRATRSSTHHAQSRCTSNSAWTTRRK